MSAVTSLWARLNPSTARAAGIQLHPEEALDLKHNHARAKAEGASLLAQRELSAADRMIVEAVLAQAATHRPYQGIRESLEWMRALIYLDGTDVERLASDPILASGIVKLAAECQSASFVERVIARSLLDAVQLLGRDACFPAVEAAAGRALTTFASVPADLIWSRTLESSGVTAPLNESEYKYVLRAAYGFEEPVETLARESERHLDLEVERIRGLVAAIGEWMPGRPRTAEEIALGFEAWRTLPGTVLENATRMTEAALDHFDHALIALDAADRAVRPESTPSAMRSLVTEGEEYLAGGLTSTPRAYCFLTESKCGAAYTLANVLFHELAHCWNMLGASRGARDLSPPLRVAGTLGTALLEGIATLREWEVFELFVQAERGSPYADIFEPLDLDRGALCREFEFDTRYWRVARIVRALFDFRVHSGRQGYVDFTREMAGRTGLSESRIHGFCFSFFEKPGYAPCYAVGASRLSELQKSFEGQGVSRREFNRFVSNMGQVPPALWRERLSALTPAGPREG